MDGNIYFPIDTILASKSYPFVFALVNQFQKCLTFFVAFGLFFDKLIDKIFFFKKIAWSVLIIYIYFWFLQFSEG